MQLNIKSSINRNVAFSRKFFSTFSTANRKGDSSTPDPDPFKVVNDIEVTKHTDAVENLLGGKIQIGKISTGTSATESGTSATESNHALNNDAQCLDHSSITSESTEQSIAKQKKVKRIKNRSNRDVADGCNSNWSIEQIEAYINIGMKPERDHLGRRGQLPSREETTKKVHKVKQVLVTMMMTEARKQEMVEDESGFGDWNSIEMQDLSIRKDGGVDSPGSVLSDCSDKECSECVSSLELDVDDEFLIVADEISVKNRGNELSLSMIENALGQRCSTTDSSGIETSSDGDIDPLACSVDSIENSITGPVVILNDFTYDQINDFFPASSDNVKEESDYVVVKRRKTSKMVNAESNSHSLKTLEEKRKGSLSNFSRMSASKETDKPIEDFTNRIIGNSTLQNSVFLSNKRSKHFKSCDVNKVSTSKTSDKYFCDVLHEVVGDERYFCNLNMIRAFHCSSLPTDYNQCNEDNHLDFNAKDSVAVFANASESKSEFERKFSKGELNLTSVDISLNDFSDFNFSSFEPATSGDE